MNKRKKIGIQNFQFKNDLRSSLAFPLNDKSDDLLIVKNYNHRSRQKFCRYSEKGELLWKLKKNNFWGPFTHWPSLTHVNSEFLFFPQRGIRSEEKLGKTQVVFANLSDGKVCKVLVMPEVVELIFRVELLGSRIAIEVGLDRSSDFYIYEWTTGAMLTKMSQIFEIPLKRNDMKCYRNFATEQLHSLEYKKVTIYTGGYFYSASFEPDLQTTWKNQESTSKILEELVLNDPVSLKSSTNENLAWQN